MFEKIEKTDKLLKLTVDTGIDVRTVVSGIAEHFKSEELIGQKVSILLNLAPRKIRGVESQGMILMAETGNGEFKLLGYISKNTDNSDITLRHGWSETGPYCSMDIDGVMKDQSSVAKFLEYPKGEPKHTYPK